MCLFNCQPLYLFYPLCLRGNIEQHYYSLYFSAIYELRTYTPLSTWLNPISRARSPYSRNLSGDTYSVTGTQLRSGWRYWPMLR